MLTLSAKIRRESGKKVKKLRQSGLVPAVLYGPGLKENPNLEVDLKDFTKVYQAAGETSLVKLEVERDDSQNKNASFLVLIHQVQRDPLSLNFSHIDFYQPSAGKEIKVNVPLVFKGESSAVKNLGAVLLKNIQELEVKALPNNLPHEIEVEIGSLDELGKMIFVRDLKLPPGVKTGRHPQDIVAAVSLPEKIEEELAKPLEEKVEEVKVMEKKTKEEKETINE